MSRLEKAFKQPAPRLIPFIMTGDPSIEVTEELIMEMDQAGVAAIELGVPFSDPSADGPVIQAASERALSQQVTCRDVLELGRRVRKRGCQTPLILFSYLNPLFQYGMEDLFQAASEAGFDGVIIPDLPFEESSSFRPLSSRYQLPLISFVAPTSQKRMQKIGEEAEGFLYCISSLGTTGTRQEFADQIESFLQEVKQYSRVPIAIGFGISEPKHVRYFSEWVDAVIVGSALVKRIAERKERLIQKNSRQQALEEIISFVKELRK
jgi:tryptophan synthase alpha chain